MIRRVSFSALAGVFLGAPLLAQTPQEAVARGWETFITTCKDALFDQNGFIAETPNPGPGGVNAVAQSADGQIVEARRFPDNQMISLRITGGSGKRITMCSAHEQGFNAAQIDLSQSQNAAPWVAAFDEIVRPAAPAPIVGGHLAIGFVARGMTGELIAQNDPLSHHYSSVFNWNDEDIIVTMIVAPFSLAFTAVRIEAP